MSVLPALVLAAPAAAQQSVYIGQVDPTAAVPPRRGINQNSVEPLLAVTNPAVTGLPVTGPATGNSLSAIVNASSQSGTLTPGQTQNIAVIDQAGSSNRSTIVQTGGGNDARTTVAGTGNVTAQTQDGSLNRSALGILGNSNSLTNAQIGNGNNASISVDGSGYVITNIQMGSNLSYGLSVSSANAGDKNITVEQRSIMQTQGQTANGLSPSISSVISGRSAR
jgi:hypothetical protein